MVSSLIDIYLWQYRLWRHLHQYLHSGELDEIAGHNQSLGQRCDVLGGGVKHNQPIVRQVLDGSV